MTAARGKDSPDCPGGWENRPGHPVMLRLVRVYLDGAEAWGRLAAHERANGRDPDVLAEQYAFAALCFLGQVPVPNPLGLVPPPRGLSL